MLTCLGVYRCHMKHEDGNFYEMKTTRPIAFFR